MTPDQGKAATAPPSIPPVAPPAKRSQLYWLPPAGDWNVGIRGAADADDAVAWKTLVQVANTRLGFMETIRLDRAVRRRFPAHPSATVSRTARLALLGSSTLDHLLPGIRVGALRRGIWLDTYSGGYGQYLQELLDTQSALHQFKPTTVVFCFDGEHLFGTDILLDPRDAAERVDAAASKIENLWRLVREHFGCPVIQQAILPRGVALFGNNEHQVPGSPRRLTQALNERLREMAHRHGADILSIDDRLLMDGIDLWHDPALWHRGKQEITPAASHLYGDLVGRLLAARQGHAAKCLVLDLDNTLWGGVIGDDGIEGLKLGQGNALGEAYTAFQRYARNLSKRGIILAVCSKNDQSNALAPFLRHPEMVLREADIACFVANWDDKATNLQEISRRLKIGLEHMVFADDNPFERNLVRSALPMVAVPELPEDPAFYAQCIADAGYFEGIYLTADDLQRGRQYQENQKRESLKASTGNLDDYLASLQMELLWAPFDGMDIQRITQLINKTNQFNLTTRRYTENEVRAAMEDADTITFQLRLSDRFGDNGIIGVVIVRPGADGSAAIDTWLMSCRVLGRGVECATLNLLVEQARQRGVQRLIGQYLPTEKNKIVQHHYSKLGFAGSDASESGTLWKLELANFKTLDTFVTTKKRLS
jgi:FkbH-like protein